MRRLSMAALLFSVAFLLFFMAPPLLSRQFAFYPLMKTGDVIDIFTPLFLIPLYWYLFRLDAGKAPGLPAYLFFLIFTALWVEGQGMHLAANSIGHLLIGMEIGDAYDLTHFYDEVLSHYLWHLGIFGLAVLVIIRQWRNPFTDNHASVWPLIAAGIIHGFSLFVIVIEASTSLLGIPFCLFVVLLGLFWGRWTLKQRPMLLFFFVASLVAIIFFVGWGVYWRGLPEFSEVGIID